MAQHLWALTYASDRSVHDGMPVKVVESFCDLHALKSNVNYNKNEGRVNLQLYVCHDLDIATDTGQL